ncbi:hypothetical protein K432DRAFT_158069 [Lepidopterella palustris CBS 459.81]|uniref:Uncharacterized protein n=1 Tax=Lepidopterella palustris CBS 459.81 TaxID=1314670 RepID=A0A8E2JAZ9_9PEZI|nr:hypothetical protein K432DRAFT_158069 [Lepidopterella palustris CBS 459.81]
MTARRPSSITTKEPNDSITTVHTPSAELSDEKAKAFDSPVEPGKTSSVKAIIDHWWLWEILGIVGSALSIVGLSVLLWWYQGSAVPRWSHTYHGKLGRLDGKSAHITLNAIIELMSTVSRLCLVIPITKGLSQLKWVWFAEKERTLTDLKGFEGASRQSLLESVKLLVSLQLKHFAVIAAIAVLVVQGFGFFGQQLVNYPIDYFVEDNFPKPLPPNKEQLYANWLAANANSSEFIGPLPLELQVARLSNATSYSSRDVGAGPYYSIDITMKSNIWAALYAVDPYANFATPSYFCSTGNCTWFEYSTLGVCARCSSLTSKLAKTCTPATGIDPPGVTGCDVSLPNGFSLGGDEKSRYNLMAMNTSFPPLVYTNYTSPIAIVQSITAYGTYFVNASTPINASECALVPCVLDYSVGISSQSQNNTAIGFNGESFFEDLDRVLDNYIFDGPQLSATNGPVINVPENDSRNGITHYNISGDAYLALKHYTEAVLTGFVRSPGNETLSFMSDNRTQNVPASSADAMQAIYQPCSTRDLYSNPVSDWNMCSINLLAQGMTKIIRDKDWNLTADSVIGITIVPLPKIEVGWLWIIPIIGLWLLALIVFIGTCVKTRRSRVKTWRGDPLALVFLGLGNEELERVKEHGLTEEGLSKKAEVLQVQLQFNDKQARLIQP